ncbi:hypothetical protein DOY81_014236 [Sarcophaga bullata]|nr:hypothetical protein DOY81_014236 [Sarcophaga bullata]
MARIKESAPQSKNLKKQETTLKKRENRSNTRESIAPEMTENKKNVLTKVTKETGKSVSYTLSKGAKATKESLDKGDSEGVKVVTKGISSSAKLTSDSIKAIQQNKITKKQAQQKFKQKEFSLKKESEAIESKIKKSTEGIEKLQKDIKKDKEDIAKLNKEKMQKVLKKKDKELSNLSKSKFKGQIKRKNALKKIGKSPVNLAKQSGNKFRKELESEESEGVKLVSESSLALAKATKKLTKGSAKTLKGSTKLNKQSSKVRNANLKFSKKIGILGASTSPQYEEQSGGGKQLSPQVERYRELVTNEAKAQGMEQYVDLTLAIIQVETNGMGNDIMQSSESAGFPPNHFNNPTDSVRQGIKHMKQIVNILKAYNKGYENNMKLIAQAYNYGVAFASYVGNKGGEYSLEVSELYSKTVVAPSLGNTTGQTYPYVNEVSKSLGKTYLYLNGGNFMYGDLVNQYLGFGGGNGEYSLPVDNPVITSPFGWRDWSIGGGGEFHRGLDFGNPYGTPIKAIQGGKVITSEFHYSWGNHVVILHQDGKISLYAHQSSIKVKVGDIVQTGQVIGAIGSTGDSTGPHLHLEIAKSNNLSQDNLIDPAVVLGKKIESLEEDILKHELNIEKWTKERQKINKDIAESRKEIVRIEDDISNLKYAEVFNLIQESKLDPSVALNLIQNKINQTQNEVTNNDSEDVADE